MPIALVAILPKCPLCLIAYGGIFATAEVSTLIASPILALSLAATGLLLAIGYAWRARSLVFGVFATVAVLAIADSGRVLELDLGRGLGMAAFFLGYLLEWRRRGRSTTTHLPDPQPESDTKDDD